MGLNKIVALFFFIGVIVSVDSKLYVSLTFDDNWKEHYNVSLLLDTYGFKGTFYINSGRIGTNQYLSYDKNLDMQSRGHEIAGHTVDHFNLTSLNDTDRLYQICDDRDKLMSKGLQITNFAFPFSAIFNDSDSVLNGCGYRSGRVSGGLWTPFSCNGCRSGNRLPLSVLPETNLYHLRSIAYRSYMYFDALRQIIDRGVNTTQTQNQWLILIFHRIANYTNDYSTQLYYNYYNPIEDSFNSTVGIIVYQDFVSFLDYLSNVTTTNNVTIVKVKEMFDNPNTTTTTETTTTETTTLTPTTVPSSGSVLFAYENVIWTIAFYVVFVM